MGSVKLESKDSRTKFINSVNSYLREHAFDGIDLAWQFPQVNEKKDLDYFDVKAILPYLNFVNIWIVDLHTPKQSPKLADLSAPLYSFDDRNPQPNAHSIVSWWLAQAHKLNLGIPTYGHSWSMIVEGAISGAPPLIADGPGPACQYTRTKGFAAYYEICNRVVSPTNKNVAPDKLRLVSDQSRHLGGTYAYKLPDMKNGEKEVYWVSFEEPGTINYKVEYVVRKGLGGVAIIELSLDDARGMCEGGAKYPLLKSAKVRLAWR